MAADKNAAAAAVVVVVGAAALKLLADFGNFVIFVMFAAAAAAAAAVLIIIALVAEAFVPAVQSAYAEVASDVPVPRFAAVAGPEVAYDATAALFAL